MMKGSLMLKLCMLRRLLSVILTVAAISATILLGERSADAKERDVQQERAAVAHVEEEWLRALNEADVNAIAEVLADDFIRPAPDSGQFVNKTELLQFYRSHLSRQGPSQRRIEDMTVTVYGATALARGVVTTTDSRGRVIRKLLFTDVFVKRAGKWQAVSAQENPVTVAQVPAH
jgi:ketosteroid isomerase-like protein